MTSMSTAAGWARGATVVAPPTFEEVYAKEYPALAGYCLRLVRDEQVAHDLTQEAFVRLYPRVTSIEEPRAWLYVVATNLVRDTWARQERRRRAMTALRVFHVQQVDGPDNQVRDAVDRLPVGLRVPTLLFYFADLPVADVARALGLAEGTVKRRLHDARTRLATDLGSHDD